MDDQLLFNLGDKVSFKNHPTADPGVVSAVWIDENGAQFQVEYRDLQGRFDREWFKAPSLSKAS
jgi:hypothetical protein